ASFSCGTDTLQWDRSIARWEVSTGCGADRSASWEVDVTWSTGSSNDTIHVNSTGWYWVSLASSNGCYNEVDSFYVTILDKPQAALYVSDFPDPVVPEEGIPCTIMAECAPLWLHHLPQPPGSTVSFMALGSPVANDSVLMNATGNYSFTVTLANGCSTTNVICFTLLQSVDLPEITSATMQYTYEGVPLDVEDSLAFCGALCMEGIMIPTWYNNGVPVPLGEPYYAVYSTAGGCGQTQNFVNQPFYWSAIVDETGWYPLNTHLVMYVEGCSNDSLVFDFQDSVYIVPIQAPMIQEPDTAFTCPGDTVALLLNCSNCQQVEWSGEGIIAVSAEGDTAWVNETGYFTAIATNMEQGLTCVAAEYFPVFPAIPPQLVLVPPNGLVCPGEEVLIYTPSQAAEYEWFGPNGPLNIDNDSVVVSEVGNYYLTIYTPSGCSLANGPASVQQFGSPLIVAFPDNLICPGQVAALQVQGGVITQVQWQAPLSGSDLTQTVNAGGTYACDVVSCGTSYTLTLPVIEGNPDATIDVGPFVVCGGSTVVLDGPAGDYMYLWTPGNVATEDLLVTTPGNYQLQITDSIGCTDVSEVAVVNSTNFTEPLAVDGGAVCAGTTIDLSATGSGTIGWYADSTLQLLLAEGGAYTAGPFATTDTIYAAQTENDCLGPPVPVVITILSPVVPVIEGDTALCAGADLELSVAVQAGVTFTWSTPQGTITGTDVTVDDISNTDVGTYTCTAVIPGCPGVSASVTVEVVAGPTVPVITGDTGLCAGDALNLSVPQQSGAVFAWTTPQGSISGTTVSVAQTDAS
ncbi:MAG: hypothetical protein JNM91_10275, partial [Flavobacteriales bacterium]|nr:hypothetical protein [Flavobacteriales bacterium]